MGKEENTKSIEQIRNEIIEQVSKEVGDICKKYNCQLGVWMDWRELFTNFEAIKKDPSISEMFFGLQIKFNELKDISKENKPK